MANVAKQRQSVDEFLAQAAQHLLPDGSGTNIDVRTKGIGGDTALHLAALRGDVRGVELLLDAGAFIDEQNELGRSPLYYAILEGHDSVAEYLLKKGADPDQSTELGFTPRSIAQRSQDPVLSGMMERHARGGAAKIQGSDH